MRPFLFIVESLCNIIKNSISTPHKNPSTNNKNIKNIRNIKNKSKEEPLLNESCSLPEDDEVLRASVFLLEDEPDVGDGYSSDNTLFYGKITLSTSKLNNNKLNYLKKLGKEILTNNPKFTGHIDQKDQLAM
eukprot:268827_1